MYVSGDAPAKATANTNNQSSADTKTSHMHIAPFVET